MQKQMTSAPKYTQQGVVILEALIAILIFSFAVIGIIGLQAAMVKNTAESKYRGDASYLANQTIGIMWTNSQYLSNVVAPQTTQDTFSFPINAQGLLPDIGSLLPNGTSTVTFIGNLATGNLLYEIKINWQTPGENPHSFTTQATIVGN